MVTRVRVVSAIPGTIQRLHRPRTPHPLYGGQLALVAHDDGALIWTPMRWVRRAPIGTLYDALASGGLASLAGLASHALVHELAHVALAKQNAASASRELAHGTFQTTHGASRIAGLIASLDEEVAWRCLVSLAARAAELGDREVVVKPDGRELTGHDLSPRGREVSGKEIARALLDAITLDWIRRRVTRDRARTFRASLGSLPDSLVGLHAMDTLTWVASEPSHPWWQDGVLVEGERFYCAPASEDARRVLELPDEGILPLGVG